MSKLKVAIVGCGRISGVYREAFKELNKDVEVLYAVDTKIDRAREFASHFDGCTPLTNYKEILGRDIDIAHITTPHHLHAPMSIDFMDNGHHVLVEKPMAITLEDADNMIEASKRNGVKLGVIFQTRYVKGCTELKGMIERGQLGKILGARSFLAWSRPDSYYEESDWKGTWDKEGGSVLMNQAIHSIDRVLWLVGSDVEWVEGTIATRINKTIEVEDIAEGHVRFKDGSLYQLHATNTYPINAPIEIEIVGEKGRVGLVQDTAWVQLNGKERYEIEDDMLGGIQVGPSYWGVSHKFQIEDFYEAVRDDKKVWIDGREGRKALEVVLGIYKSAREGKRIFL